MNDAREIANCSFTGITQNFCVGGLVQWLQGRRRFLKSGTAIERHRRSARTEGPSRGKGTRGVFFPLLVRGVGGDNPRKKIKDVCRSDSNAF